jgi:hypothetical protein
LRAALAIVPALELAALLPLTPANAGAASAAISVVLHTRGVPLADAVPASIVLHGVETVAAILFGAGSALLLLVSRESARRPRQPARYPAQVAASTRQTSWPRRIGRVVFAD